VTVSPGQFLTPRPLTRAWGERYTIKVPAPASATDFAFPLPPGWCYELLAVALTLKVETGKAEAEPGLILKGGQGDMRGIGICTIKTKEATNTKYLYQREIPSTGITSGGWAIGWLPEVTLDGASEVTSLTKGIETGDTITKIELFVERFTTDYDHDLAELKALAERVRRLEKELMKYAPTA